jgi:hypothetical protein
MAKRSLLSERPSYISSVITLTLFQKEMNLIVQSMYELRAG